MSSQAAKRSDSIAIVGMALRVPGATSPEQFWRNIVGKVDSLTRTSIAALRESGASEKLLEDPRFVPVRPLVPDVEYFDAAYFDMTPFDAERTDPAHRLFLECSAEALERAGIPCGPDAPVTGVFGGTGGQAYFDANLARRGDDLDDPAIALALRLGSALDFMPSRVSYKLGLVGPSFTVQAACSTALIAVHLAVDSLRRGECDVALAGGANVDVPLTAGYVSGVEGMMSKSGFLRPFDAAADGTIFGSGVGVVVLRRLEDALADGNPIHAVIRGSATNNDGAPRDKASFVAPSVGGQVAVLTRALADAQVDPSTIGYVEAHGTGTPLGDPIEVQALTEVYRRHTSRTQYCGLGSVKANVGHLRAAAGIAGLIKAVLALEHRTLPPALHFENANPAIDFASTPFFVNTEPRAWDRKEGPERAAVSAFGFGGSNVHMILEAAPERPELRRSAGRPQLLVVSARTERAVERRLHDLQAHMQAHPEVSRADIAHTLRAGRTAFAHRAAMILEDGAPARLMKEEMISASSGGERPVVFLFPGQGVQRPGMGQSLYAAEPVYRDTVDQCAAILQPDLGFDIRTLLHPPSAEASAAATDVLRQTSNAQPAIFTVSYALARLAKSWGVTPRAMAGHSFGEYVAACIAGTFSLEDALRLVALRGRLMQRCEPGAMLAVFLPEAEVRARLGELEIAAVNAPAVVAVSGRHAAIDRFADELTREGIGHRRLATSHAFHSRMMEPALADFRTAVAAIERRAPRIPFVSCVSGDWLTETEALDPDYWAIQMRRAVRFADGVATLASVGEPLYLELGPGRSLTSLMGQHGQAHSAAGALCGRDGKPAEDEPRAMLESMGWLWCHGARVDWRAFDKGQPARKVLLPTYPFQRQRYWLDPEPAAAAPRAGVVAKPAKRPESGLALYQTGWQQRPLASTPSPLEEGTWLVFGDTRGLAEALVARLWSVGARVVQVRPGKECDLGAPDAVSIRPGSKADLAALLGAPQIAREGPLRVLHLWSVTGRDEVRSSVAAFDTAAEYGFHTLLALMQAGSDLGHADRLRVLAIADGVCALDDEANVLRPEKSVLLGPCRVLPQEVPGLSMRCVDIPAPDGGTPPDWMIEAILAEACHEDSAPLVAVRPHGRYVEQLAPVPPLAAGRLRLRDEGVVLITGGVGGLGLEVARDLFEAARARLALLSRWAAPPRETWPTRAQQNDGIGQALRKVLALEARGAEVLIVTADAGDERQMRDALEQVRRHFGTLDGVVHAAGVVFDEAALTKRREVADQVLGAKVRGALILENLLAETPLDFLVYFSSIAAQLPGPGRVDYAAANSVLDSLARGRGPACHGLRCAIGWDAWRDVGMAVRWAARETSIEATFSPALAGDVADSVEPVGHPLVQIRVRAADGSIRYRGALDPARQWVLGEHRVDDRPLLPAAGMVESVRAAFDDFVGGASAIELTDLAFVKPLFVDAAGPVMEIAFEPEGDAYRFELRSLRPEEKDGAPAVHAMGHARVCASTDARVEVAYELPLHDALSRKSAITGGPRWHCVQHREAVGDFTRGRVELPRKFHGDLAEYGLHPALLDLSWYAPADRFYEESVPLAFDSIRIYGKLPAQVYVQGNRRVVVGTNTIDATLHDAEGRTLVEIEGYTKRKLNVARRTDVQSPSRLKLERPGELASLVVAPDAPQAPRPGEIQIEVVAAGINFRDVLSALGQLPGADGGVGELGSECSGVVSAVGEGVEGIRIGDAVMAFASHSFATHVSTPADFAATIPAGITFEQAAGIPIAYLTADYGLNHLARLGKGERVLIHSASGGVGLAAVQLARAAGAEIFATAGSPEKRDYLRQLGIEHVMDSRSLDFADEVRERTKGEGVDVVLNALAGAYIERNIELLRPFGRFVEIGKRDIYANTPLGLSPFRRNLAYFAVDLGVMRMCRPAQLKALMLGLVERLGKGELEPLPTVTVPFAEAASGFEQIARARHIGKVVVSVREAKMASEQHGDGKSGDRFSELYGQGIPVAGGLAMLRRLLSSDETPAHVIVTPHRFAATGNARRASESASGRARRGLTTPYAEPTRADEMILATLWRDMLGVELVGIHDDFVALGGNSITAIQILYGVRREFNVRLPATAIFENPTVARLAAAIRGELGEKAADDESAVAVLSMELAALDEATAARLLRETRGEA